MAACGRGDGACHVVHSDNARRRHYTSRQQARIPSLLQDGPFRYSRNPGYLSLAMIYAGIAILWNALWAIHFLPLLLVVTQRELIEREERYLERTFGEEYLTYKRRVRR
jgi:protein-S-isoprenylcysteine O-methyltransferase Ste14